MTEAPIRLALIGLGTMGMAHLEVFSGLAPRAQIAALADSHPPFADRAALHVPSAAVFYDPLDCLNDANVDAAVVATADDTHHGIVDACIARGIHVLCEKPLTTSAEQSLQLVEAECAKGRQVVQVGYMRRYDSDYRRAYETLRSGQIGEPILISQRHRNPLAVNNFDARKLIANTASHEIDLFRWLTGEEITEVSATAKASQDKSTVTVVLTLKSPSGVLGVVEVGRGPGMKYDIGCDIVASRGVLAVAPPAARRMPAAWIERFAGAYRAQNAAWLAAVATESITGPSAYDGYATNAVIDAALFALQRGNGQPVHQVPASTARLPERCSESTNIAKPGPEMPGRR
jgi:myo-inositol 2-dehydrogenase / D-chiro-inositol 1-dehydrogenase